MPLTLALPDRAALLLDCDGTLIDLAATPDSVVVPDGLLDGLRRLRERLDGALAVVSGRPVAQIDALLGDAPTAVAGEHGASLRLTPGGELIHVELPAPPAAWIAAATATVVAFPGALVEHKRRGFVLHYRQAPAAALILERLAREMVAEDTRFTVLPAAMAWEVRALGVDKGTAVAAIMAAAPFAGRVPVFVGDDVTDADGMAEARRRGGQGLFVPEVFGDAAGVRAWIASLVR